MAVSLLEQERGKQKMWTQGEGLNFYFFRVRVFNFYQYVFWNILMYSAVLVIFINDDYVTNLVNNKQPKLSAHAGMQFINHAAEMRI